MPLETATYIHELVATNPVGATDPRSQGDDHLRLIKSTIQNTFPNVEGEVTPTHLELNYAGESFSALREINGNLAPLTDLSFHFGSNTKRWLRLYAADVRVDDNSIMLDQDGAGVLRLGGTAQDWVRALTEKEFLANKGVRTNGVSDGFDGSGAGVEMAYSGGAAFLDAGTRDGAGNLSLNQLLNVRGSIVNIESASGVVQLNPSTSAQYVVHGASREIGFRGGEQLSLAAGNNFDATHRGRAVAASSTGNFTINTGIFNVGDWWIFVNTAGGNCTIVAGSGVTIRLDGAPGVTGNRTVSDQSIAYIYAQSGSVFICGGAGTS